MSAAQDEFNELMRDKSQRTRHPEDDNNDAESFLNLSDEEQDEDDDDTPPSPPQDSAPSRASTSIPARRYAANTGPKGVISDAQNFRDSRASARSSMASTRPPAQHSSRSNSRPGAAQNGIEEEDDDELDDDGPGDRGFMARWRQSRIKDMQQSGSRESKMHLNGKSRNAYGGIATVDGEGYLDAVDKSGTDTVVVVYIYDEYVSCPLIRGLMGVQELTIGHSRRLVTCSRHVFVRWRVSIGIRGLSSCIMMMLRWSLRAFLRLLRIVEGRSLRDWCHWWMRCLTMRI